MHRELTLSRRTFLGASAGAAATVALGRWAPSARASERLVPPGKLGIQLFTVRDQIPRLHNSVTDTNAYRYTKSVVYPQSMDRHGRLSVRR